MCSLITRMVAFRTLLLCAVLVPAGVTASAQQYLVGVDKFPQFRGLSGLGGGGYGVDAYGNPSATGPVAYSTPVARVLGHNHFRADMDDIFAHKGFFVGGAGNGTGILTFGTTLGRFNVAVSDMVLSSRFDQAFNIQVQFAPSVAKFDPPYNPNDAPRLAYSLGVQDVGGGGGSSGDGLPGDSKTSRSFFGTVTWQASTGTHAAYLSAGIGSRRFAHGFCSASINVAGPVRAWAEYDGFAVNTGLLISVPVRVFNRPTELNFHIQSVAGRYLGVGVGFGV